MTNLRHEEYQLQCAVADYLRYQLPHGVYWTAISHGTNLGVTPTARLIRGRRLKRAGHKAGVADIFLSWKSPTDPMPSVAWIEMKSKRGALSVEQKGFRDEVRALGHEYVVARGIDDVQRALEAWGLK